MVVVPVKKIKNNTTEPMPESTGKKTEERGESVMSLRTHQSSENIII